MQVDVDTHIKDIRTQGYTFCPGFIEKHAVGSILDSVKPFLTGLDTSYGTAKASQITLAMFRTAAGRKAMRDVIYDPTLNSVLSAFLSSPFVEHTKILVKAPRGPDTPWHQDAAFWTAFDPDKTMLSAWIALEPVTIENGCMELVKAADPIHEIMPHESVRDGKEMEIPNSELSPVLEKSKVEAIQMQPGDMLIFNSTAIHRALPNNTDDARIAIKIVFQDYQKRNKAVPKHVSSVDMQGFKGFLNKTNSCCLTARRV